MQQAVGLMGAMVDHHACSQGFVVEAFKTDVQQFTDGVFLDCVELVDIRLGAPQAHKECPYWFYYGPNPATEPFRNARSRFGNVHRKSIRSRCV
jgi:hypothetical protein